MSNRPLHVIAREARDDWRKAKGGIYFGAVPYLRAMDSMDSITDEYGADSGESVVAYFLSNAGTWRGEVARRIKAELNAQVEGRTIMADIWVNNQGSIVLLTPVSDAANEWIEDHIPDDAMYFGTALVVEHRYADDVIDGMMGDGLIVEPII